MRILALTEDHSLAVALSFASGDREVVTIRTIHDLDVESDLDFDVMIVDSGTTSRGLVAASGLALMGVQSPCLLIGDADAIELGLTIGAQSRVLIRPFDLEQLDAALAELVPATQPAPAHGRPSRRVAEGKDDDKAIGGFAARLRGPRRRDSFTARETPSASDPAPPSTLAAPPPAPMPMRSKPPVPAAAAAPAPAPVRTQPPAPALPPVPAARPAPAPVPAPRPAPAPAARSAPPPVASPTPTAATSAPPAQSRPQAPTGPSRVDLPPPWQPVPDRVDATPPAPDGSPREPARLPAESAAAVPEQPFEPDPLILRVEEGDDAGAEPVREEPAAGDAIEATTEVDQPASSAVEDEPVADLEQPATDEERVADLEQPATDEERVADLEQPATDDHSELTPPTPLDDVPQEPTLDEGPAQEPTRAEQLAQEPTLDEQLAPEPTLDEQPAQVAATGEDPAPEGPAPAIRSAPAPAPTSAPVAAPPPVGPPRQPVVEQAAQPLRLVEPPPPTPEPEVHEPAASLQPPSPASWRQAAPEAPILTLHRSTPAPATPAAAAQPPLGESRRRRRRLRLVAREATEPVMDRVTRSALALEDLAGLLAEIPALADGSRIAGAIIEEITDAFAPKVAGVWARRDDDTFTLLASLGLTRVEERMSVPADQPLLSQLTEPGGALCVSPVDQAQSLVLGIPGAARSGAFMAAALGVGKACDAIVTVGRQELGDEDLDRLMQVVSESASALGVALRLQRLHGIRADEDLPVDGDSTSEQAESL